MAVVAGGGRVHPDAQHERLGAGQVRGDKRGDVAVAAMLAQDRGRVPEPGHRLVWYGQGEVGRGQRPAASLEVGGGGRELVRRRGEVGGGRRPRGKAQQFAQACGSPGLPGGQHIRGRGQVPYRWQCPAHHGGSEDEERCDHRGSGDGAHRSGPAGEVAPPETAEAGLLERRSGRRREVGDHVDRLEQGPHLPGRGRRVVHAAIMAGPRTNHYMAVTTGRPGQCLPFRGETASRSPRPAARQPRCRP